MSDFIKNGPKMTVLAAAVTFALFANSTYANDSALSEGVNWKKRQEVNDVALDAMRGRFVSGSQVLFFGVEMYTQWKTELGDIHSASLNIGIDRGGNQIRPTVTLVSFAGSNNDAPATSGIGSYQQGATSGQISSGGLDQVKGVGQVIQVTGNYNGITNAIGVDIGSSRPDGFDAANSNNGNSSSIDTPSGAVSTTYVLNNNAGVSVIVPGQGQAGQSINEILGMQQKAQVYGDLNQISNRLNLSIQMQAIGQTPMAQMTATLRNIRGLSTAGIF